MDMVGYSRCRPRECCCGCCLFAIRFFNTSVEKPYLIHNSGNVGVTVSRLDKYAGI